MRVAVVELQDRSDTHRHSIVDMLVSRIHLEAPPFDYNMDLSIDIGPSIVVVIVDPYDPQSQQESWLAVVDKLAVLDFYFVQPIPEPFVLDYFPVQHQSVVTQSEASLVALVENFPVVEIVSELDALVK